ncbi:MAG: serine/threonine protein kinase [Candidatus Sumerlaeaceae bacterium]|nr:serine/threonine protein kinase [Candidatus Sumerlaeaceae bacterium]
MSDEKKPGDDDSVFQLPEDSLKSWNAEHSVLLMSFDRIEAGAQSPAQDADASGMDATKMIADQPTSPASPSPSDSTPDPRLVFRHKIGSGGFGEVWEAIQMRLARPVAVKTVRKDLCATKEDDNPRHQFIDANLRQESLTAATLDHPNIVPVYDLQNDERGFPALAMKLVRGRAWQDIITEDFPRMTPEEFLAKHIPIFICLCQAVAFAHSRGVLHRDLKPAQVMVGDYGEVLLMDWGLGIVFDKVALEQAVQTEPPESLPTLQSASNPAGTVAYMAPEQTCPNALTVGPWTDVYLLGGVLYQLLTGTQPHAANSSEAAFQHARAGIVLSPRQRAPERDMPQELVDLCMDALKPATQERPQSGKEFLERLIAYQSGSAKRQQSRELTEEATRLLSKANGEYCNLARCEELVSRAKELWPENHAAASLSRKVFAEYARAAISSGDLQLAGVLTAKLPDGDERKGLEQGVTNAAKSRHRREMERRIAMGIGLVALLVIIAGGYFYNRQLSESHRSAVKARQNAEALISGLQDNLFQRLQSSGQVKLLEEFGQEVDGYFKGLDPSAVSDATRERQLTSLFSLQQTELKLGNTTSSLKLAERALATALELEKSKPGDPYTAALLARARTRYSELLLQEGSNRDRALQLARDAAAGLDSLDVSKFSDIESGIVAARTAQDLSNVLLFMQGDTTSAAELLERAHEIRDALLARDPDNQILLDGKSTYMLRSAALCVGTGKLDDAMKHLEEGLAIRKRLSEADPNNLANRAEIGRLMFWVGRVNERKGHTTAALAAHKESLAIRQDLVQRDPFDYSLKWELATSTGKVAEMEYNLGDLQDAETSLSSTLSLLDHAPTSERQDHDFEVALGTALLVKGRMMADGGNTKGAREQWTRAAQVFQRLERISPYEYFMLRYLCEALLRLDRVQDAETVAAKLRHLGYKGAVLSKMLQEKGLKPL